MQAELPSVKAPDLSDFRVQVVAPSAPTPEDLLARLHDRRWKSAPRAVKSAGEPLEPGDEILCDWFCLVAGKFAPGTLQVGQTRELRPLIHLPGLMEAVARLPVGSASTIPVTLPEDYPVARLAGKECHFYVEIRQAWSVALPSWEDDAQAELSEIAEEIDLEQGDELLLDATEAVIDELVRRLGHLEIPAPAIDRELLRLWPGAGGNYLKEREFPQTFQDQALDDFLEDAELRYDAERRIRCSLALAALVEQEQLTLQRENVEEQLEAASEAAAVGVQEALKALAQDPASARRVAETMLYQEALELVMSRTQFEILEDP